MYHHAGYHKFYKNTHQNTTKLCEKSLYLEINFVQLLFSEHLVRKVYTWSNSSLTFFAVKPIKLW